MVLITLLLEDDLVFLQGVGAQFRQLRYNVTPPPPKVSLL
jgi:hypothetical protein